MERERKKTEKKEWESDCFVDLCNGNNTNQNYNWKDWHKTIQNEYHTEYRSEYNVEKAGIFFISFSLVCCLMYTMQII